MKMFPQLRFMAAGILMGILAIGSNQNSNMGVAAINWGVTNITPTLPTDAALPTSIFFFFIYLEISFSVI
jgi:hypothetical protein